MDVSHFQDPYTGKTADELILFHGMRQPLQGECLLPGSERTINGRKGNCIFCDTLSVQNIDVRF
jgi:hypothetical protein